MFFRVKHQKIVQVYLLVFTIISVLVVFAAFIAYRMLLHEQREEIQAVIAKLMNSDDINQRLGKCIDR